MKIPFFILGFIVLFLSENQSQVILNFSPEMRFVTYLIDKSEYKNAIHLMKKIELKTLTHTQSDSLNYYLGWSYNKNKINDSSALYFGKVSETSSFYFKSNFYQTLNYIDTKKYEEGTLVLNALKTDTNENYKQLKFFEEAGISLLKKDYTLFDSLSSKFNYAYSPISEEQQELTEYSRQMKKYKKKSPLVAALLSTAIPGLGKIYAGKKGQGLSAFFTCVVFGAIAAENIVKSGYKSPQSIVFESLFSMFYIGNIYGSALSVKLSRNSFFKTKQDEILVTLHFPLHRVFSE